MQIPIALVGYLFAFLVAGMIFCYISVRLVTPRLQPFLPPPNPTPSRDMYKLYWRFGPGIVIAIFTLAPFIEELLFRFLPVLMCREWQWNVWGTLAVWFITTLWFAYGHKEEKTLLPFPLMFFLWGSVLWAIMYYFDYWAAVAFHIGNNVIVAYDLLKVFKERLLAGSIPKTKNDQPLGV